jgi:hypothetical protein
MEKSIWGEDVNEFKPERHFDYNENDFKNIFLYYYFIKK